MQRAWELTKRAVYVLSGLAALAYLVRAVRAALSGPAEDSARNKRDLELVQDAVREHQEAAARDRETSQRHREAARELQEQALAESERTGDLPADKLRDEHERRRDRLRLLRGGSCILACWLATGTVRADEHMPHPVTGEAGMWVSIADYRADARHAAELESLRPALQHYAISLDALRSAMVHADDANTMCTGSLSASYRMLDVLEARLSDARAWYRSPGLWFTVGAVAGAAIPSTVWAVSR